MTHRTPSRLVPVVLAALVAATAPAWAQGQSVLEGFSPTGDYLLKVDGELDRGAEIYFQSRLPGYLVMPSKLNNPVLLVPRSRSVQAVAIMKISRQPDGSLDLAPDAIYRNLGPFAIEGSSIAFDVEGQRYVLEQKPDLLGLHPASGLEEYATSYRSLARSYRPSTSALDELRGEEREVHVRVYFGSWCPFCQRYVPRMVRVANELEGSGVKIDFYGLPKAMDDPVNRRMNVEAVPTGVVFVDGKEAGRILSQEWQEPEKALVKILADS